jgi:hypothetical protein
MHRRSEMSKGAQPMQNLRHKRLAQQLNETALALMAEARVSDPQEGKELRLLATELDRVRVSLLAGQRQTKQIDQIDQSELVPVWPQIEAA